MYEFIIPQKMRETAQWMADEMGQLNNSIRQGEGNIYGFLGELVFVHLTDAIHNNTYDWDVEMPHGATVDVKTKCVTSPPRNYYDCSVAAIGTNQNCDYYAFVRVHKDCTTAWYLGAMAKQTFLSQSRLLNAGVVDGDNGWAPTIDCYNVKISDLHFDKEDLASLPPLPLSAILVDDGAEA